MTFVNGIGNHVELRYCRKSLNMQVLRHVITLREQLDAEREIGSVTGFVPTMGALHEGHLVLVRRMLEECESGVASIFVNPTQFNDKEDLNRYPRPIEEDIILLNEQGCDYLFLPDVSEVYPDGSGDAPAPDLGGLDKGMEGAFRPGHFEGVAQVMMRLLHIVQPDRLYMGQKDYQQAAIIQYLIRTTGMPVEFVLCDTIRETDGLAMSSRNRLLDEKARALAPIIYRTLQAASKETTQLPIEQALSNARKALTTEGVTLEYFEIVDGITLQPISNPNEHDSIVACCAAWIGGVRLIDNVIVR